MTKPAPSTNNVNTDQIADGLTFHNRRDELGRVEQLHRNTATTDCHVVRRSRRTPTDTFAKNTVQTPVLANGIAL